MVKVFLGLGTNTDRERSMRAGLAALKKLDVGMVVSTIYESAALGFEGAPFYNCVAQLRTELTLVDLLAQLKSIEDANGRNRTAQSGEGKGLDIDVLTYADWVGEFAGVELPRSDIQRYAHVLLPLAEIAPNDLLPGTATTFQALWEGFDQGRQQLSVAEFTATSQ